VKVTFAPVSAVDGVQPHPTVADMDVKPITVMLQLVRPARPEGRLFGDDWLTLMDENGWRV
jgi:hypothetical protein